MPQMAGRMPVSAGWKPAPLFSKHASAGDLPEQLEEGAFALGVKRPLYWRRLIALDIIIFPGIEITPGRMLRDCGDEVVFGLVKIEVIVFVEEDRLGRVTRHGPGLAHHLGNAGWLRHTVAVKEKKIRRANDVLS